MKATCKDCVHYELCKDDVELHHDFYDCLEEDGVEKHCEYFKPKSRFVEVVRCKECKHRVKPSKMCAHPKAVGWDAIEPEDDDFCSYGEKALKEREKE